MAYIIQLRLEKQTLIPKQGLQVIKIIPYSELGHANFGWLDAHYHFNFGDYYHPERQGFGQLLVINDDRIAPGKGFPMHPHRDMEIITYVRQGAISHEDNQGNHGKTKAGDVQIMSAGSGIYHSEYNLETEETRLYQIWIRPNHKVLKPRWETKSFPQQAVVDHLFLLASGDGKAPLHIHQDAYLYAGALQAGLSIHHPLRYQGYLLVAEGCILLNGEKMSQGDGAEITDESQITIDAQQASKVLLIDVISNP